MFRNKNNPKVFNNHRFLHKINKIFNNNKILCNKIVLRSKIVLFYNNNSNNSKIIHFNNNIRVYFNSIKAIFSINFNKIFLKYANNKIII